ncbi:T9SS type B sorting domain-containing protein [Tenacibaculum crassostreae]|uniref:T9SS type B sorting domain-containing protein n=1 Tax=Tenacibaculum crassostreae TaxID=502683 RepID=UPI0038948873
MKKNTKSILVLLAIFLFCVNSSVSSQTLLTPELGFGGEACSGNQLDFSVTFKYTAWFNSDNVFTVELSDANGNWGSPTNLGSVTTENQSPTLSFVFSFQLPDDTYGANYKIRLVSTSPAMISPESASFEAYKFSTATLAINDFAEQVVACEGESVELFLNTDQKGAYNWFKDDVFLITTEDPKLTVSESGIYQVKIDYGVCGNKDSITMPVIILTPSDSQIKDSSPVEICGDKSHKFEASVSYSSLTYNWYKDNTLVQSSNSPIYDTPTTGQFGTYRLEIVAEECTTVSDNVELQPKTTAGFNVNTSGALTRVILPGETIELCITHDASSGTIQWYKDDVPLAARTQPCMNATDPGIYYARVTQSTGSSCDAVVDSENYTLLGVKSFTPTIRTEPDYEDCKFSSAKLSTVGVKVIATDDNEYDLTADQLAMLSYQWKKDGTPVSGATTNEYTVSSYLDNGTYVLNAGVVGVNSDSNELDIKVIEAPEIISSSNSNSLCLPTAITYTINNFISGYTYQWIKDGTDDVTPADPRTLEVTEVGEYVLKYSGFGCDNELAPIVVVPFDDSAVTVTPSEVVVLEAGGSEIVIASGGESYEWYQGEDTSGALLSTTEQLTVTSLGFYTVFAKVGDCSVVKTIEVVEPDGQIIVPNIVSPNQDGFNDTWKLSNSYAYQPNVEVILYDSNGKEILKTTDYKNDWPTQNLGNQKIFYYKIVKDEKLMKAGTISVID